MELLERDIDNMNGAGKDVKGADKLVDQEFVMLKQSITIIITCDLWEIEDKLIVKLSLQ